VRANALGDWSDHWCTACNGVCNFKGHVHAHPTIAHESLHAPLQRVVRETCGHHPRFSMINVRDSPTVGHPRGPISLLHVHRGKAHAPLHCFVGFVHAVHDTTTNTHAHTTHVHTHHLRQRACPSRLAHRRSLFPSSSPLDLGSSLSGRRRRAERTMSSVRCRTRSEREEGNTTVIVSVCAITSSAFMVLTMNCHLMLPAYPTPTPAYTHTHTHTHTHTQHQRG
jgi:hypothetical protein